MAVVSVFSLICCGDPPLYESAEFSRYHQQLALRALPSRSKSERFAGFIEGRLQVALPSWWALRLNYFENGIPAGTEDIEELNDVDLKKNIEDRLPQPGRFEVTVFHGVHKIKTDKNRKRIRHLEGDYFAVNDEFEFDLTKTKDDRTELFAILEDDNTIKIISFDSDGIPNWVRRVSLTPSKPRGSTGPMLPSCVEILAFADRILVVGANRFDSFLCLVDPQDGEEIFSFRIDHFDAP